MFFATLQRDIPGRPPGRSAASNDLALCSKALACALAAAGLVFVACARRDPGALPDERAVVKPVFRACRQAYLTGGLAQRSAEAFLSEFGENQRAASAFARAVSGQAEFLVGSWSLRLVPLNDREESICSERFRVPEAPRQSTGDKAVPPRILQEDWDRRLDVEARLGRRPGEEGLCVTSIAVVLPTAFSEDDVFRLLVSCFRRGLFRVRLETQDYGRLRLLQRNTR